MLPGYHGGQVASLLCFPGTMGYTDLPTIPILYTPGYTRTLPCYTAVIIPAGRLHAAQT